MTITVIYHSPINHLMVRLLALHQDGKDLPHDFIQENGLVLQQIFKRGWGSYSVCKMQSGRYLARRKHKGILTPPGLIIAKEISAQE